MNDKTIIFIFVVLAILWILLLLKVIYTWIKYELYIRSKYPNNTTRLTFWSWNKFQTTTNLLKPFKVNDSNFSMLKRNIAIASWGLLGVSILIGLFILLVINI
jgi:hypothetical protein